MTAAVESIPDNPKAQEAMNVWGGAAMSRTDIPSRRPESNAEERQVTGVAALNHSTAGPADRHLYQQPVPVGTEAEGGRTGGRKDRGRGTGPEDAGEARRQEEGTEDKQPEGEVGT